MDLSLYSVSELVELYSNTIQELKKRGVLRTKNVIGELGEHMVIEQYLKSDVLPTLATVPLGTQDYNAKSQDGKRYIIKSTSGNVTGVFYGLNGTEIPKKPLFDYVVICKFDSNYSLEAIYQLTWEKFLKHKKWHSRMKAWNLPVNKAVIEDSLVVYRKDKTTSLKKTIVTIKEPIAEIPDVPTKLKVGYWEKKEKVNHNQVREETIKVLNRKYHFNVKKQSQSRYVSDDNETCVFVLSASYSNNNQEYWYSINDEIIPWLDDYPQCYVAFAMGSEKHVLVFSRDELKEQIIPYCLRTKEDVTKKKKAHFHFSFAVEGRKLVYFKAKVPEHQFVDVTRFIL